MKKLFMFAAAALMAVSFVSCNKDDEGKDDEGNVKVKIETAAENLVAYFGFEAKDVLGEGITLDGTKGAGSLDETGFIGKCYANTAKLNTQEAYVKYNLAAKNAIRSLESFTFTAWVNLPADKEAKGAIMSLNGTGVEPVWPSWVFLFDNLYKSEDDGQYYQQFNGRMDFLTVDGKPALWPNCAAVELNTKDKWFQIARTYDAATGHWANYCDGILINEGDFLIDENPVGGVNACVANDCNALYLGGWASKIEGKASDGWLNYFCGSIDEVRFFNKALSAEEVVALRREELAISLQ